MSLIVRSFSLTTQPVWKKKTDICSVRTLLCDKWRSRPTEAHLHVRCTNLPSVTLQHGFTDDSTSLSIRQKSSESWKQFEGSCPGFTCLVAFSTFSILFWVSVLTCEDLNPDLSGANSKQGYSFIRTDVYRREYIWTKATCHCMYSPS